MNEKRNWIVIVCKTKDPLVGFNNRVMKFSTEEVAEEVASQLFKSNNDYLIFDTRKLDKVILKVEDLI